jgi:hypothetical protein
VVGIWRIETEAGKTVLAVSGKIGLWSKADSYMHFDEFAVTASE